MEKCENISKKKAVKEKINKTILDDAAGLWTFFTGGYGFLSVVPVLHFPDSHLAKNFYIVVDNAFRLFIRTDE